MPCISWISLASWFMKLKLIGPIFISNFVYSFKRWGFNKNVYDNTHCSSYPGQLSHILIIKKCWKILFTEQATFNDIALFRLILKFSPDVEAETLTSLWMESKYELCSDKSKINLCTFCSFFSWGLRVLIPNIRGTKPNGSLS